MSVQSVKAIINGQEYTLTLNSSTGKYEATVTAPSKSSYTKSGGYYPVTLTATDNAGNSTTIDSTHSQLGAKLRLVVKEKVAPVITILSPASGAYLINNQPVINFKITDDDSGVDFESIKISIDNGEQEFDYDGVTNEGNGNYSFDCVPPDYYFSDGPHTVTITASDNDGNAAVAKSVSFTIDTVPPTLNVTNPADGTVTNQKTVTVSGTTNDATSSPVVLTINGETVSVSTNGSFSKVVTLKEGANTIVVVATDVAGKSTTVTRTVKLDTGAPVFKSVTITPNPVDAGKTYVISVSVEDL